MKCQTCVDSGMRSRVRIREQSSTLMGFSPSYWDEDGNYQPAIDPNTMTTHYRCSQGHTWAEETGGHVTNSYTYESP